MDLNCLKYNKKSQKKIVLLFTALFLAFFIFLKIKPLLTKALTNTFIQSDWSGGADTETTIDDNNLEGWTKFYSKTGSIDTSTANQTTLEIEISQPE